LLNYIDRQCRFFTGTIEMNRKPHSMPKDTVSIQCSAPTQELTIKIPCRLAKRIEAYADKKGDEITGVVIEALDVFLREQKGR